MKTQNTVEFAKICKHLSTYFFNVAPDPRVFKRNDDGYEYEEKYIASFDNLKKIDFDDKESAPLYEVYELKQAYSNFNKEVNENIIDSDEGFVNKLVRHFFNNCLPYEKLLPCEEQFFRESMFDEAELLYTLKAISREMNQRFGSISLMNDPIPF